MVTRNDDNVIESQHVGAYQQGSLPLTRSGKAPQPKQCRNGRDWWHGGLDWRTEERQSGKAAQHSVDSHGPGHPAIVMQIRVASVTLAAFLKMPPWRG
jgi:hypothetical protein